MPFLVQHLICRSIEHQGLLAGLVCLTEDFVTSVPQAGSILCRNQQVQATMFTELGNNLMRALFDPKLPDDERQKLLATMQGFMSAMNRLPQPRVTRIQEEEEA